MTELTITLSAVSYVIIGMAFLGMFPDSNGEPNVFMIGLWPLAIVIFIIYLLLYSAYHFGKKIRKEFIYARRNKRGYQRRKQRTM